MSNTNDFSSNSRPLGARTAYLRNKAQSQKLKNSQPQSVFDHKSTNFEWEDLVTDNQDRVFHQSAYNHKNPNEPLINKDFNSNQTDTFELDKNSNLTNSPTALYSEEVTNELNSQNNQVLSDQILPSDALQNSPHENSLSDRKFNGVQFPQQKWKTQELVSQELHDVKTEPLLDSAKNQSDVSFADEEDLSGSLTELLETNQQTLSTDDVLDDDEIDVFDEISPTQRVEKLSAPIVQQYSIAPAKDNQGSSKTFELKPVFKENNSTLTKLTKTHSGSIPEITGTPNRSINMSQIMQNIQSLDDNSDLSNKLGSRFNNQVAQYKQQPQSINKFPVLQNDNHQLNKQEDAVSSTQNLNQHQILAQQKKLDKLAKKTQKKVMQITFIWILAIIAWLVVVVPLIIVAVKVLGGI
ncbi:hypothetical protein [[Mycoplasma] testudinis]|uniref:hypothetical protein n=1 Tax=[Mycoplasma] testudinis TaxID=33924 RepID=UPI0004858963|nr:hypothetical protein [[Mycoplasma] testudinis]